MNEEFVSLLLENIGKLFGDRCEIVVHDFTNGFENTIVKIVNGHVSGRGVGGCPTNLFFESYPFQGDVELQSRFSLYFSTTDDDRLIKSSSTFIKNKKGDITGAVCINFDVSELLRSRKSLDDFIKYDKNEQKPALDNELFVRNVQELFDVYLSKVEQVIGKPCKEMNKAERLRALTFLDQRGVLQISKASTRLCKHFAISKYTLYCYLEEIRGTKSAGLHDSRNACAAESEEM
ncbi:MAG: helix-turn-helix transcriptional regulator [Synergistaceae bacterium]|jgi:predicted transcriptional regulator YheO|nr:helix-turn-helix transcriptional regulator [Synergistaceae bacterium]